MATPLVLLGADLRDALQQCGPLFVSFAMASLGTIVGCIIGYKYIAGNWLQRALGTHDGLIIAAALLAKNVGGGINYMAVCQSFQASPMAVAAGLCVDNLFALVYFPLTSLLANGLSDVVVPQPQSSIHSTRAADDCIDDSSNTITVKSISTVLFTASALLWAGQKLGGTGAALPACSLLTVVVASVAPRKIINANRTTAELLGSVVLYLFFATAGAPGLAVADSVRSSILPLSAFLFSLYSIHGVVLWIGYYLFGQTFPSMYPQRLLVASSAAIGGPATATALANAAGWKSLCVPGVLVGNIGYAIATFCGILFVRLLA